MPFISGYCCFAFKAFIVKQLQEVQRATCLHERSGEKAGPFYLYQSSKRKLCQTWLLNFLNIGGKIKGFTSALLEKVFNLHGRNMFRLRLTEGRFSL